VVSHMLHLAARRGREYAVECAREPARGMCAGTRVIRHSDALARYLELVTVLGGEERAGIAIA
jgi:hypothetical protein